MSSKKRPVSCKMKLHVCVWLIALFEIASTNTPVGKFGDPRAICTERKLVQTSRYVPYTETYRDWSLQAGSYPVSEIKVRQNYRIEWSYEWKIEAVCCPSYNDTNGFCEPICTPPCNNGQCVSPYECVCYSGYTASTTSKDVACEPVCRNDCINGKCTAPNECTCEEGYRPSNNLYVCEPHCDPPCTAGTICIAPQTCRCDSGYRFVNSTQSCEPICEPACGEAGTCESPNNCTCHEGFRFVAEVTNDTNDATSGCQPFCEACGPHANCVAPNECVCQAGYVLKTNDTDELGCVSSCENDCNGNGKCIDDHGTCSCRYAWTGPKCDEEKWCLVAMEGDNRQAAGVTLIGQEHMEKDVKEAFENAPLCWSCLTEVNNNTACYKFEYPTEDGDAYGVVCLIHKDSDCFNNYRRFLTRHVFTVIGSIGGIALLIMIGTTLTACILAKRGRRNSILYGRQRNNDLLQRRNTAEALLTEKTSNL